MRKIKILTAVAIITTTLTSCAQHSWTPAPGTDPNTFARADGVCKLAALGVSTPNGFIGASGSPAFVGTMVGGGLLLSSLNTIARQHQAHEACLQAAGFIPSPIN